MIQIECKNNSYTLICQIACYCLPVGSPQKLTGHSKELGCIVKMMKHSFSVTVRILGENCQPETAIHDTITLT